MSKPVRNRAWPAPNRGYQAASIFPSSGTFLIIYLVHCAHHCLLHHIQLSRFVLPVNISWNSKRHRTVLSHLYERGNKPYLSCSTMRPHLPFARVVASFAPLRSLSWSRPHLQTFPYQPSAGSVTTPKLPLRLEARIEQHPELLWFTLAQVARKNGADGEENS